MCVCVCVCVSERGCRGVQPEDLAACLDAMARSPDAVLLRVRRQPEAADHTP